MRGRGLPRRPCRSTSSSPRRSSPTARSSPAAAAGAARLPAGSSIAARPAAGSSLALEPKTGKIAWKYDLGPKPERLDPPITIKDSLGQPHLLLRPGDEHDLEHALLRRGDRHALLRHRREHGAPAADRRQPEPAHAGVVRHRRAGRAHRPAAVGHADQAGRRLDQCHARLRPEGRPVQGPVDRRHAQALHDPRGGEADQGGRRRLQERRLLRAARLGRQAPRSHADLHRPADVSALARAGPADARPAELHRRLADRLRHRRQDDLHQRHRRDPADVAGEDGRQRRAADGRAGGRHQHGHADRALAARAAEGRLARRPAAQAGVHATSATRSPRASPSPTASCISPLWPAASSSPSTPRPARSSRRFALGPVWSGPSVSRGRVYVGTGNTLFSPSDSEAFFPKKYTGELYSFGLPGEDEVDRLGGK